MAFLGKGIENKFHLKQNIILLAGLIVLLLSINVFSPRNGGEFASADTSGLSGYAWSDNIGWVSLSGSNYGIAIDNNGKLSGYAWSDNIGWITANESELSGCPSNPCRAKLNGNAFSGWLRALSNGGGWDGWISLSGNSPSYGVTQDQSTAALSGYAWGSDVIGWLDFSQASGPTCTSVYSCSGTDTILYKNIACQTSTYATCEPPTFCSSGVSTCLYPQPTFIPSTSTGMTGHLQPLPALVTSGDTIQVHWNVDNVTSCTVTGTNGDSWTGLSSGSAGKTSNPILGQTTFTLTCSAYPGVTPPTFSESETANIIPIFQEL
ncbi:MAG: hypothetical protein Q7S05_03635 [bacterium]|nr:hypothetical protein [bacterium]